MSNAIEKISFKGTSQQIGGDNFDGQWITKRSTISSSFTLQPDENATFSMANYLPDNNYNYEVLFELLVNTNTTEGDYIESKLYSGNLGNFTQRCSRLRTRAPSTQTGATAVIVPILASNQNVIINSYSGSVGTSTLSLYAKKYRRIGKNGTLNQYVSYINVNGTSHIIDGNMFDGNWIPASTYLFQTTLEANGSSDLDLSDALPNDGNTYLCMFSITGRTGTTSGNSINIRLGTDSGTNNPLVCRHVTRTNSNMTCAGNIRIPCSNRTVQVYNSGNATSGTITVVLRGYRRVGTNA